MKNLTFEFELAEPEFNLIQHVEMAWHETYELSDFGKLVLTFNNIKFK